MYSLPGLRGHRNRPSPPTSPVSQIKNPLDILEDVCERRPPGCIKSPNPDQPGCKAWRRRGKAREKREEKKGYMLERSKEKKEEATTINDSRFQKSSPTSPPPSSPTKSTLCTNSFVSRATSNANGGNLFVKLFQAAASLIPSPSTLASSSLVRQSARVLMTGSARCCKLALRVSVLACWVSATTLPTMDAMSPICSLMTAGLSSARMLPTRDWIEWTSASVWSSRKIWELLAFDGS